MPSKHHHHRRTGSSSATLLLLLLSAALLLSFAVTSSQAQLQIVRPRVLHNLIRRSAWLRFGVMPWTGREYRGTLTWVPNTALCSAIADPIDLDADAALPRPVTHNGPQAYSEIAGTVAFFELSTQCPPLNQVFYAEVVLGVVGAVVAVPVKNPSQAFPSRFSFTLTAPVSHIPSAEVDYDAYQRLRSTVVNLAVPVEVSLGWSTSSMLYG